MWISRKNHTFRIAGDAGILVVHFLSQADRSLAELFGGTTGETSTSSHDVGGATGPVERP